MEFTQEQITELGLQENQVEKLNELTSAYEASLKKEAAGGSPRSERALYDSLALRNWR